MMTISPSDARSLGSSKAALHLRGSVVFPFGVVFSLIMLLLTFCVGCKAEDRTVQVSEAPEPEMEVAMKFKPGSSAESSEYSRPSNEHLRETLSPESYRVACEGGTEPPFRNAYWNHKEPGIYVDVISGEPLFSSTDKFDSGTGWPSFTKPIEGGNIVEKNDTSHGMVRTEVRSKGGDAHLGHVFPDGPDPNGMRYCINSASLRFVPADKLEAEGYGRFRHLFAAK